MRTTVATTTRRYTAQQARWTACTGMRESRGIEYRRSPRKIITAEWLNLATQLFLGLAVEVDRMDQRLCGQAMTIHTLQHKCLVEVKRRRLRFRLLGIKRARRAIRRTRLLTTNDLRFGRLARYPSLSHHLEGMQVVDENNPKAPRE